jgi:hypothetical protein
MLNHMGIPRFTQAPDEWLRKNVFSGQAVRAGVTAYCTTWDQPTVLAVARLETVANGQGYKALTRTMWSDGYDSFRIGDACPGRSRDQVAEPSSYCNAETGRQHQSQPDHWALVYVDETGLSCALDPADGFVPVRETCWASLAAARGTSLG